MICPNCGTLCTTRWERIAGWLHELHTCMNPMCNWKNYFYKTSCASNTLVYNPEASHENTLDTGALENWK